MTIGSKWIHPPVSRRVAIEAGTIGLIGLGMHDVAKLRADSADSSTRSTLDDRSCIFIFLSGGLSQLDSFDLKPAAPNEIRGEFRPIDTRTPGVQICEHLPMLAARSNMWALCRSMTHSSNDHSAGHLMMLSGRTALPAGFNPSQPQSTDWPSLASIAGTVAGRRDQRLPTSAVLPDRLVHYSGRIIPGQFAGSMGAAANPWFIEASPFHNTSYGAFPLYQFDHQQRGHADNRVFLAPSLKLPHELTRPRVDARLTLLRHVDNQRRQLDRFASSPGFDRYRQAAVSLLTDRRVQAALDVTRLDERAQDRYGRNSFGWSLLMARRLIEAGVTMVQVNLGNNETWDTHGNMFPHLKDKLFPPTDRALSALLDDLQASGQLDHTHIVMAGEFGRTPKISLLPQYYKLPGRDHWGAVQTVFFAGGGVRGGTVVGASDRSGAFPKSSPQSPESMAASIFHSLGVPTNSCWHDDVGRPHPVFLADPIRELFA